MGKKIVLIDGHSILNRAFYGVPDLTNSEGIHTNAVYGFLNIMLKILDEEKPEYLTVAFDVKQPTFRHEMYAQYKGTRKPMPEELREQVPLIQEVLRAMGVRIVMKEGYEADDVLGTIAQMAEREGMEVSLVSGDRDLLQLATEKIMVRIPKTKRGHTEVEDYHTQDVIDKYGITPPQIVDLKGLMGDSSDNIPGVAGVGEKTAVKILTAYPTVESAYEHLDEITPKRTHDLLEKDRENAFLSKELATIKTDCVLDYRLEDAAMPQLFNEQAFEIVKRLEFKSLLKRFGEDSMQTRTQELEILRLETKKEWDKFFSDLKKSKPDVAGLGILADAWTSSGAKRKKSSRKSGGQLTMVFDENGGGLSFQEEEREYPFYGISVSYQKGEDVVTGCAVTGHDLDAEYLVGQVRRMVQELPHIALLDWKNALHHMTPVQELSEGEEPASQNGFPDETVEQQNMLFEKITDLEIAAYLLNPLKDTYQADDIGRDYLDMTLSSYAELFGKETVQELVGRESAEVETKLLRYLANISYVSCLAFPVMKRELERQGMWELYRTIEMPAVYFLYQMEHLGVRANRAVLEEMAGLLQERAESLEKEIYELAGEAIARR